MSVLFVIVEAQAMRNFTLWRKRQRSFALLL